jgi:hypothetical protein
MGRYLTLLGVLASLGGCAGLADPYQRAGTWAPTDVNADNLRAMVVNPIDLQQGKGPPDTIGIGATTAVTRYRTDTVKELPTSTLSTVGGQSGTGGQSGGGAGGAGGGGQ